MNYRSATLVSLAILTSAVLATFAYLAVTQWWIAFNSDYAMVGLVGKSILESGRQFIFVPEVGYQGLLLEGNLAALMFRLFGVTPQALHLVPWIVHLGLIGATLWLIGRASGLSVAILTILGFTVSSPLWHELLYRTQPNYGSTFLLGMLLIGIFLSWQQRPTRLKLVLGGFVAGFGFYNYGQIAFFFAALGVSIWISYRNLIPLRFEVRRGWGTVCLGIASLIILLCVPMFLFGAVDVRIGDQVYGLRIKSYLKIAGVLLILWQYSLAPKDWKTLVLRFGVCFWPGALGFLIGYAPKLYYNLVLGLPSFSRLKAVIGLPEILRNFGIFWNGQARYFGFSEGTVSLHVVTLLTWGGMIWAWVRLKHRIPQPLYWLPFVTFFLFLGGDSVIDEFGNRYLAVLWIPLAYAWALIVVEPFRTGKWKSPQTVLIVSGFILLLGLRGDRLIRWWTTPTPNEFTSVIETLKQEGVTEAVSEYWPAYTISFQTQERIAVKPIIGADYLRFYDERIGNASRLAVISGPHHRELSPPTEWSDRPLLTRTHSFPPYEIRIYDRPQ